MLIKNRRIKSQKGFTIIELLIATTVFSVVLLIVSTGIVRIGQAYYKGIIQNRTQEVARSISEEVSRSIQLADGQKRDVPGQNKFCIGDVRYTYNIGQVVGPGVIGLTTEKIDPLASCADASGSFAQELLGPNMRLLRFSVNSADNNQGKVWRVEVRVAYADAQSNDLLTPYKNDGTPNNPATLANDISNATCKSGIPGSAFCATAQLDTTVKKRLNSSL